MPDVEKFTSPLLWFHILEILLKPAGSLLLFEVEGPGMDVDEVQLKPS